MNLFTDEELQEIVRTTNEIYKMAYITYKPLADDLCSRVASYEEVEHFWDWILDFCGNDT